jgi:hypothetical protein
MRNAWILLVLSGFLILATAEEGVAQAPLPSFPLYCQGPLKTGPRTPPPAGPTLTPFNWAAKGAGAENPGPGECAWADRGSRPEEEVKRDAPGGHGANSICDWSGAVTDLPASEFLEVGVYRDPAVDNCMHMTHYIGKVTPSPSFSPVPALPPFIRQSIDKLTPAQVAALRKGFAVMMSRPATDPTSFRFQANIHSTNDAPTTAQQAALWNQCNHGSIYFLSWHRMYLYFFDRILRTASGDPNLVLPYWNWSDPAQHNLPIVFRSPSNSSNSLFLPPSSAPDHAFGVDRPPDIDSGTGFLPASDVSFSAAFAYTNFEAPGGSGVSFGGQDVSPGHFQIPHGALESQPHDVVHGDLGGYMADTQTASLDPIFYLHHANIDRLWNHWIEDGGGRADPLSDAEWMNTTFTFVDEAGHEIGLTGSQILDTVGDMNYRYDDDKVVGQARPAPRPGARAEAEARPAVALAATVASEPPIALAGAPVTVSLPVSEAARSVVETDAAAEGRRFVLQLDDIRPNDSPDASRQAGSRTPKAPTMSDR